MTDEREGCILCLGPAGDRELRRVEVWQDRLWRLTVSLESEVRGLAYLEPKRHIPYLTDLDGREARSFGTVLRRAAQALRRATGAEAVYAYVFGTDVPHFHVHLAPHREGDALSSQLVRGEVVKEALPGGGTRQLSRDFPVLPEEDLRRAAERVRELLKD